MKKLLLAVALLTTLSCQTFTKWLSRSPSSSHVERSAKHYIFSLHGLGGGQQTFGALLSAMENHLEVVDPKFDVITKPFYYGTGLQDAQVPKFIADFESFLAAFFNEHELSPKDKISLVTHSQGGLIATLWYAKAISGADQKQLLFASKVSSLVTAGTPFWGSSIAHVISDQLPYKWMKYLVYKLMAVGGIEVRDMSTASQNIFNFFREKSSANFEYLENPRMLNIVGVTPGWQVKKIGNHYDSYLKRRLNMGNRWESDQVVSVPSARLGFLFYSDSINKSIYGEIKSEISEEQFNYSQYFSRDPELRLAEAVHIPTSEDVYGIARIPEKCLKAENCDHPTYAMMFRHVSQCEEKNSSCDMEQYQHLRTQLFKDDLSYGQKSSDELKNQMRTFQLGFNLQLPKGFKLPKDALTQAGITKYLHVDYIHGHKEKKHFKASAIEDALIVREFPFQDYRIQLGRYREWGSRVAKHIPEADLLNVQFTGSVQPTDPYWKIDYKDPENWSNRQFPITIKVQIPGLKPRTISVPVKPIFTTFVELVMEEEK